MLATASGYQDRIVLRDTVWVDETYINDTDLSKGYGQARKRDQSRQKLCICVAIDVHKITVAVVCGHGKPSSARVRKAMGGTIAPGSLPIHDVVRAHGAPCRSTRDGARILIRVFADAYERQPVVITTNWSSAGGDRCSGLIERARAEKGDAPLAQPEGKTE